MAVYSINEWKDLKVETVVTIKGGDGKTENRTTAELLDGASNDLVMFKGLGVAGNVQSGSIIGYTGGTPKGTLGVGIYELNGGNVYAAASSVASAPGTISGGWKLIASGTGTTTAWSSSASASPLNGISLQMASGANRTLGIDSDSVVSIKGSSDTDKVFIKDIASSAVLDFGAGDSIYFLGDNQLRSLTAAEGVKVLSSADASSAGGEVVLKSGFSSTVEISGGVDGKTLTFTLQNSGSGANSASFVSSSGTVNVTGAGAADTVSIGDVLKGTTTVDLKAADDVINADTLTGGVLSIAAGAGSDTINVKEVAGGTLTVTNTSGATVKIDTVSSGKVNLTIAGATGVAADATVSGAFTGGTGVFTGGKSGKSILTLGSGTVLKDAKVDGVSGTTDSLTFGGSGAMSVVASSAAGNVSFVGDAADLISIKSIEAASDVSVFAKTTADTLTVGSIGAQSSVVAHNAGSTRKVVLASGTKLNEIAISDDNTNLKLTGGTGVVSLVGASITGTANITGSTKDDYFNITSINSGNKVTLAGGSGNDGYYFTGSSVNGGVTITDFGWATSSEEALNAASGLDVLYVDDLSTATLGKIQYSGGTVTFGKNNIVLTGAGEQDAVYAKIAKNGEDASTAETYKITASGANVVGSDSPQSVTSYKTDTDGTKVYDAASKEHAYVKVATGETAVTGVTAYNGTNERTASIIDTNIPLSEMTQTADASGNITLSDADGTNTVELRNFATGQAIKVGGYNTSDQSAVVLGGTGVNSVEAGIGAESLPTYYLGASGGNSSFDFSGTAKKTIDLSGKSEDDKATYSNVKGVTGSDDGGSKLISGDTAVTLAAAGKDDTLSGAGAGADTLVSASGKATNFLLQSGNGADIVSGFSFGTGANNDKVLINDNITYNTSIITASSGKVKIGDDNGTLSMSGAGTGSALVQYDYGDGEHPGVILADVSDGGGKVAFDEAANLIIGQGATTTLVAGKGDEAEALSDDMPSGIGWNSKYIVSNVGVVDASASDMGAVNGQVNVSDKVIASTGASVSPVWVCGGLGDNFSDSGNDTLVASGQGHDEIFVGAKMGNDVIENFTSKDKITFIDTKVSDFGGNIDDIIKIDTTGKTFTATFATATSTTTIKGTAVTTMDRTTNLTFHFDDQDYVWDGKTLSPVEA